MAAAVFGASVATAWADGGPPPPPPPPPPPQVTTSSPPPAGTTAPEGPVAPTPVRGLSATTRTAGRTVLTWENPSAGLGAIVVVRTAAGRCATSPAAGTRIGPTTVRTRQVDTTERDHSAYCYAVFALDAVGDSSAAAVRDAIVNPGDVTPPGAVTALHSTTGSDAVMLTWSNPPGRLARVLVRRGSRGSCPASQADGIAIGGTSVRTRQVDAAARPGASYCYSVFAVDPAGNASPAGSTTAAMRATAAPGAGDQLGPLARAVSVVGGGVLALAAVAYLAVRVRRRPSIRERLPYGRRQTAPIALRREDVTALLIPVLIGAVLVSGLIAVLLGAV